MSAGAGIAYLVGAGPGDPGLVTLRAKELIESAEVLIYDYLCNPELLRWAPPETEIIYAGKSGAAHTLTQDEINRRIVDHTRAGRRVVRLKGGDPFVFGRGGEEAEELVAAGLAFEIVPGVTSAVAAPAYAGIPITHRAHASMFTVLTGHEDPSKEGSSLDWETLARLPGTKVMLMGVERLGPVTSAWIENGGDPNLPAALVRWGTWSRQEVLEGTLGTIADLAAARGFKAPAVAVFGTVVSLRSKLDWFGKRPLSGRRVVVTRTRAQASRLSARLREAGADVLEIPTIRIEPVPPTPREETLLREFSSRFDWLLLTSPNAADLFFERFLALHGDLRALGSARIAVLGPATSARVRKLFLAVDKWPAETFTAAGLAEAFSDGEARGKRFFFPRGDLAGNELPEGLRARGALVEEWTVYKTVPETEDRAGARARYAAEGADWIAFASASAAENWHRLGLAVPEGKAARIASMGPETSRALRALGYEIGAEAREQTIEGLVDAVIGAAK